MWNPSVLTPSFFRQSTFFTTEAQRSVLKRLFGLFSPINYRIKAAAFCWWMFDMNLRFHFTTEAQRSVLKRLFGLFLPINYRIRCVLLVNVWHESTFSFYHSGTEKRIENIDRLVFTNPTPNPLCFACECLTWIYFFILPQWHRKPYREYWSACFYQSNTELKPLHFAGESLTTIYVFILPRSHKEWYWKSLFAVLYASMSANQKIAF